MDDQLFFYNALGKLWKLGEKINWEALNCDVKRHKISLPTYSFDKRNIGLKVILLN